MPRNHGLIYSPDDAITRRALDLVRSSDRVDQEIVLGLLPADDLPNDRLRDVEVEEGDIGNASLVAVFLEVILRVDPSHFDKEDVGVLRRGQV